MPVEPHGQMARSRTLDYLMLQVAFKVIHYPFLKYEVTYGT
jgi:hypothetical protein